MATPTDRSGLVKDMSTGAVLSEDLTALEAYRRRRRATKIQNQQVRHLESRVDLLHETLVNMQAEIMLLKKQHEIR